MFERFTDRARKVMALANQHALRRGDEYIDTGHVMLAMVEDGSGIAAQVLQTLNVDFESLATTTTELMSPPSPHASSGTGKLSQVPRMKTVVLRAIEESHQLNHNYVGTEHLLLGLVRDEDGAGGEALR